MKTLFNIFLFSLLGLIFLSCGPSADSKYDSGYSDGYAEGYNTSLNIRATLVEGDWNNPHYSRGYTDGRAEGVRDAKKISE
jgi:hypothetical protein